MRGVLLLSLLAVAVPAGQGVTPQEIRGRVVAAEGGAALPRVRLTVTGVGNLAEAVFTDDRGRFVLTVPPSAGTPIRVSAAKAAFATTLVQLPRSSPSSAHEIVVRLARGAAISGRVVDPAGGPVVAAAVIVRTATAPGVAADQTTTASAVLTNDLGDYRLGGLPEGRYTVQVGTAPLPVRDAQHALNDRLLRNPLDLPAAAGDPIIVAVRAGDEVSAPDLVAAASAAGERCPAAPAAPANAPSATASLRGRVLDAAGRPLLCATVRLMRPSGASPIVTTDAAGRFAHAGLPAGNYRVEALKTGYTPAWHGQDGSNRSGRMIGLRDGEAVDRIDVVLARRPAVTGTVTDDHGEPVAGVAVRLLQLRTSGDLTMAVSAPLVTTLPTDDRGRYRVFGVSPGRYLVSTSIDASVSDPDGAYGYAPIFHPGTTDVATAVPLDVGVAGDVGGVDLVLIRSPTRRISGFAFDASGRPARQVIVFASQRSSRIMLEPRTQPVGPDGAFAVANVPPGEHVIQVIAQAAGGAGRGGTAGIEFGMQYVTVGGRDPAPVTVRATGGSTVEGRLIVRGGGDVPDVTLFPVPTDFDRSPIVGSGPAGFATLEDGRFRVAGVTGRRRFQLMRIPDGWYLASVTVNGQDAMNTPFDFGADEQIFSDVEAVLSNAAAAVGGRVDDARAASDYSVIVFATDRSHWFRNSQRLKAGRPGADGGFRVGGLPPGDYFVAAVDALDVTPVGNVDWQDPALLERLSSRAERITLDEREVHLGTFRRLER